MTRFIIKIEDDDILPEVALDCCRQVVERGRVSSTAQGPQYSFGTTFTHGIMVFCVKRGKSERFVVQRDRNPNS